MNIITRVLALVACAVAAQAANYQNFSVAVYIPVGVVNTFKDPAVLRSQWEQINSQVRVDKVYIEVQRGRELASDALLEDVKQFFREHGVAVAGGSAFSDASDGQFKSFCYTNPADRDFVRHTAELAARHFDEVILDDFFFVTTKDASDIAAKGSRSWTDFRLALMDEASQELILKPAKAVNPKCRVIIKYPNWYEHFQGLGYDLEHEPAMFDGIYTGTETRDPFITDQFLQQYESYEIMRYLEAVSPGRNGGGWVDTYNTTYVDRYSEQLWDTVLGKAREVTLFMWEDLTLPAVEGNRQAWAKSRTGVAYDALKASYRPAPGGPATPSWAAVAGTALRQVDGVAAKLGHPIGVASYKPFQSTGEDFLHNFIGMLGIPVELGPKFPKDAPLVLLTESAGHDPKIVDEIKAQLEVGKTVVITSGLLRALQGRGIEDICEARVGEGRVVATSYSTGYGSGERTGLKADNPPPPILFPQVHFMTNDAWSLVSAIGSGNGYPVLLMDRYAKGSLLVWTIPDNFRDLYFLPEAVTARIKDFLMRGLPVRLDGESQVALFCYDNGTAVVESYLDHETTATLTVQGHASALRNLETGERFSPVAGSPAPARHRPAPPSTAFTVRIPAHSYAAFAIEP
jgi:hypothetical protein